MKLLLITAIEEFENEIIKILKNLGVKVFSYQSVKGYRNDENTLESWFSKEHLSVDSLLFTVFVEQELENKIYENIQILNSKLETLSKVHLATVMLEKSL